MALGLSLGLGLGFAASAGGLITFLTPADQTIFTNAAANTITTSGAGALTADGVSIGATSGAPATLSWTPAGVDNDVTLASNADTRKLAVVAADSQNMWDISTWTQTNVTTTSGQADPDGGTNAYKVVAVNGGSSVNHRINKSVSGKPVAANSSAELWISPIGTLLPVLRFYPIDSYGEIKPVSGAPGESLVDTSSIHIVETKTVSGREWYRVWYRGEMGVTLNDIYIDFLAGFSTNNQTVASGEHGFYLYHPRYVSGALPFYQHQRIAVNTPTTVSGVVTWNCRHVFNELTGLGTRRELKIKVLLPDTYDANRATPYPVVFVQGVEPEPSAFQDELQVAKTAGYHNTYDCIFVTFTTPIMPWHGSKNNGDYDYSAMWLAMREWMAEYYNASTDRNDLMLLGYSKGGFGAFSLALRNPTYFGYAAAWDVPFTMTYADMVTAGYEVATAFGTEAQFNLYSPSLIADDYVASVGDKTRLVIGDGPYFPTSYTGMKSILDGLSIEYTDIGTIASAHDATATWMGPSVAALFALRASS